MREIRRNAYLIADESNNVVGVYNSRQLRPYRETKLKEQYDIYILERTDGKRIKNTIEKIETYEEFCKGIEERRLKGTAWKMDNKNGDSVVSSSNKIDQDPTEGREDKTLYKTDTDIIVIDDEDSDEGRKEEGVEEIKEDVKGSEILKIMKIIYDITDKPKQYAWINEEMVTLTYAKELNYNAITDTQIEVIKRAKRVFRKDNEITIEKEEESSIEIIRKR